MHFMLTLQVIALREREKGLKSVNKKAEKCGSQKEQKYAYFSKVFSSAAVLRYFERGECRGKRSSKSV